MSFYFSEARRASGTFEFEFSSFNVIVGFICFLFIVFVFIFDFGFFFIVVVFFIVSFGIVFFLFFKNRLYVFVCVSAFSSNSCFINYIFVIMFFGFCCFNDV